MDENQPATTAPPPSLAQPTTVSTLLAQESSAGSPVPQTRVAERSLLDEDVPFVENMEEPIKPTRMQTMFAFHPGLSASRWRPRTTFNGRPIDGRPIDGRPIDD